MQHRIKKNLRLKDEIEELKNAKFKFKESTIKGRASAIDILDKRIKE